MTLGPLSLARVYAWSSSVQGREDGVPGGGDVLLEIQSWLDSIAQERVAGASGGRKVNVVHDRGARIAKARANPARAMASQALAAFVRTPASEGPNAWRTTLLL